MYRYQFDQRIMKPSVLFLMASIRSHLIPAFYIANLLKNSYVVYFAITDEILRELVEEQGFLSIMHSRLRPGLQQEAEYLAGIKKEKITRRRLVKAIRTDEVYAYRKEELRHIMETTNPAGVFIDIFNSTDLISMYKDYAHIPALFVNPMLSTYRINGYPAVMEGFRTTGTEIPPSPGKPRLSWKTYFQNPFGALVSMLYKKQYQRLMQTSGIANAHPQAKDGTCATLFENVPECVLAPLELEFSPGIRKLSQIYVGLSISDCRKDTELDESFEHRFKAIVKAKEAGKRVVYCTFGTFYQGADRPLLDFLRRLLDALEEVPDLEVLLSVNRFITETLHHQRQLPPHIHMFTRVPQLRVLAVTDLFITHGGLGSVKESIHFGVPMLVYPLDLRYDQDGNGLKVEYHGLGLRGEFNRERMQDMKEKIAVLLNHPVYRANTEAFRQKVQEAYPESDLRMQLESLLHRHNKNEVKISGKEQITA